MIGETVEVELREVVTQTDRSQTCAMLLEERQPASTGKHRRILPVFIGPVEAVALGRAALGDRAPRPQTHDLVVNVAESLGANLQRAIITRLERQHSEGSTFIAALEYLTAAGDTVLVDSRPSDALVVATQCGAPIHVAVAVMDLAGVPGESSGDDPPPADGPGDA